MGQTELAFILLASSSYTVSLTGCIIIKQMSESDRPRHLLTCMQTVLGTSALPVMISYHPD